MYTQKTHWMMTRVRFLIIIINGARSICVCFNHDAYVSLLEVIINKSLDAWE